MSLTLLRAYRAASDVGFGGLGVAAAPSGGFYLTDASTTALFARVAADGSISWKKELTYSGATLSAGAVASNATHAALVFPYLDGSLAPHINASLYDSSGSLVWQTALELDTNGSPLESSSVAMRSDNTLAVLALSTDLSRVDLQKLNPSTGALTWSVNLAPTSGSLYLGRIQFLSGGDLILLMRVGSSQYLQRLSGTDGSVVWSRSINWVVGSYYGIAVDTSDNIYAWGPAVTGTNGPELPVVKVDSSGSTVWSKLVRSPSSQADPLQFATGGRGMANTSGVYIPCVFSTATEKAGHIFVPADGASTPLLTHFVRASSVQYGATTFGESGAQLTMGYVGGGASYDEARLLSDLGNAGDDGTYGSFTRATTSFSVATSSVSLASATYTRAAQFYDSPTTPITASVATDSLAVAAVAVSTTYTASSVPTTTAFGTPSSRFVCNASGFSSTALGIPSLQLTAAGIAPTAAFGTPVLTLNSTRLATALASTLAFGQPWAERGLAPAPHTATGIPAGTAFGKAAVANTRTGVASGSADTAFGTPRVQQVCVATGLSGGALGAPTLKLPCRATALAAGAQFGAPMVSGFGGATGFSSTRFGTPEAVWTALSTATGLSSTAFGTPSTLKNMQRARSGVFRTRFGLAQCERTAP